MSNNWWFSAFRQQGGPTWYGDNRTPVITDTTTVKIAILFGIFLIAFLVIFPGIRRTVVNEDEFYSREANIRTKYFYGHFFQRWTSFISITLALVVGALIVVCIYHPSWHVAAIHVSSPYKAFASDRLNALLGVNVGLKHVNITLKGAPERESHHHLNYNERFTFYDVKSMQNDLREGLQKGLPYPILSIIEYLGVDKAGFVWGRHYRLAGYYTCILLWLSFALWLLHLLILCLAPQYYSRTLIGLGLCISLADVVYVLSCPNNLYIPFANVQGANQLLTFQLGWCYWATVTAGATCLLVGSIIRILESKSFCKFSTFLQLNFDELYDNAGNLQLPNFEERHYQERTVVSLSQLSTETGAGPALNQGKDQFVEVDETPKSSRMPKSNSTDDCASSSADSAAKSQIGR